MTPHDCRANYSGCTIQFALPQWTSETRFEYSVVHYYQPKEEGE